MFKFSTKVLKFVKFREKMAKLKLWASYANLKKNDI